MNQKKSFLSPEHIWRRIARVAAVYGGEFDKEYYLRLISNPVKFVASIKELQEAGAEFAQADCTHWMLQLWGTFEVTHPRYTPPKLHDTLASHKLHADVMIMEGFDPETCEPLLKLSAVRDEVGDKRFIGFFVDFPTASIEVNRLETAGEWPEGFDAIIVKPDGTEWYLADTWEPM